MSDDLRDARLAQALKHMPDANLQPGAQARSAILQEAARVADASQRVKQSGVPDARQHWWQLLWGASGSHTPWNAAFASVALVFFVTLLWYEQEVPDVRPKVASIEPQAKVAKPAEPATARRSADNAVVAEAPPAQAAPAAPAAAPARPATATPAPAVALAAGPAAKSLARAEAAPPVAAAEQRSRASLSAGAPVGAMSPVTVAISQGALQQRVSAQAAQPLLAMLRALSYAPAAALPKRAEASGDLLVVEVSGQERWVINGNQVSREELGTRPTEQAAERQSNSASSAADVASRSELANLTPAQASELRRLALDIAASGK